MYCKPSMFGCNSPTGLNSWTDLLQNEPLVGEEEECKQVS